MNSAPAMVQLPKKKAAVVNAALAQLTDAGVIDDATRLHIAAHIEPLPFDWRRLARYAFLASVACIVIAIGAVAADQALLTLLQKLFHLPWAGKAIGCAALAGALFVVGIKRRAAQPEKIYSNEAIFFGGVLGLAGAIACLGKAIDTGTGHFSLLLLLAALVYGALGFALRSKLVWTFSLLSLGSWFGAETGYVSGWGAYYLGMAYPLRFVLFGSALTLATLLMRRRPGWAELFGVSRVMGLLYLFIALWILSIWGNFEGYEAWHRASHWELAHWSLYFGAAAVGAIYLGLKHDDGVLRGFGVTFLAINLYTRFFEFFWDGLHKAVFFAVLGVSLWFLGAHAEALWNARALRRHVK